MKKKGCLNSKDILQKYNVKRIIYISSIIFVLINVLYEDSSLVLYLKTNYKYSALVLLIIYVCSLIFIKDKRK